MLRGERVVLRPFKPEDVEPLWRAKLDPLTWARTTAQPLPEHQGKGLGKDVLRVLLGYGFRCRNLHRVHLETLASNQAGLRCYRSVGFVEEGRLREAAWVEGGYEDMVLMSVLRPEWSGV